jgi:hypothetical protein
MLLFCSDVNENLCFQNASVSAPTTVPRSAGAAVVSNDSIRRSSSVSFLAMVVLLGDDGNRERPLTGVPADPGTEVFSECRSDSLRPQEIDSTYRLIRMRV